MPRFLTPKQAASNAQVHVKTLMEWVHKGWVVAKLQPNHRNWLIVCDDNGQPMKTEA